MQQLELPLNGTPAAAVERNTPVTPDALANLKGLVEQLEKHRPFIEKALSYTGKTHTFNDIVDMIMKGSLVFIPIGDSFIIVETIHYPQCKHLHIFLGGGEKHEILDFQPKLIEIARNIGCSALTMSGRDGWQPYVDKLGWKRSHTSVILEI